MTTDLVSRSRLAAVLDAQTMFMEAEAAMSENKVDAMILGHSAKMIRLCADLVREFPS